MVDILAVVEPRFKSTIKHYIHLPIRKSWDLYLEGHFFFLDSVSCKKLEFPNCKMLSKIWEAYIGFYFYFRKMLVSKCWWSTPAEDTDTSIGNWDAFPFHDPWSMIEQKHGKDLSLWAGYRMHLGIYFTMVFVLIFFLTSTTLTTHRLASGTTINQTIDEVL